MDTSRAPVAEIRDVFGVQVKTCSFPAAVDLICGWLSAPDGEPRSVGYINPHVYNRCFHDVEVLRFVQSCDLVCIDGVGISLAAKWLGLQPLQRAVATHVFDRVLGRLRRPVRALLVGATDVEARRAAATINARSAGLTVTAVLDGFRSLDDYRQAFERGPNCDLILLGMGTPRSEATALLARQALPHALVWLIGGGTLQIYAGTKRRAPAVVSRLGLEWLHRIWYEPATRSRYTEGSTEFARHLLAWKRAHTSC
jgi:N-acetylglucosaminyldiphosphoundecaprenol N-acetyl-beta-D-mannosaminyltransferase